MAFLRELLLQASASDRAQTVHTLQASEVPAAAGLVQASRPSPLLQVLGTHTQGGLPQLVWWERQSSQHMCALWLQGEF